MEPTLPMTRCGCYATLPMTQCGRYATLPNVANDPDAVRTISNVFDEDAMLIAQSVTTDALAVEVGSLETVSRSWHLLKQVTKYYSIYMYNEALH